MCSSPQNNFQYADALKCHSQDTVFAVVVRRIVVCLERAKEKRVENFQGSAMLRILIMFLDVFLKGTTIYCMDFSHSKTAQWPSSMRRLSRFPDVNWVPI